MKAWKIICAVVYFFNFRRWKMWRLWNHESGYTGREMWLERLTKKDRQWIMRHGMPHMDEGQLDYFVGKIAKGEAAWKEFWDREKLISYLKRLPAWPRYRLVQQVALNAELCSMNDGFLILYEFFGNQIPQKYLDELIKNGKELAMNKEILFIIEQQPIYVAKQIMEGIASKGWIEPIALFYERSPRSLKECAELCLQRYKNSGNQVFTAMLMCTEFEQNATQACILAEDWPYAVQLIEYLQNKTGTEPAVRDMIDALTIALYKAGKMVIKRDGVPAQTETAPA